MASLAVTMNGQITLKRDLLQHLGVKPGERIDFDKLPGGELRVKAARPTGTIDPFIGRHAGKLSKDEVAVTIRDLLDAGNVVMNRPAVEAGLEVLESGGDFADGVMAYEGYWLGGETFVSFDKQAVSPPTDQGLAARLLA